jgi:hypothetical protein
MACSGTALLFFSDSYNVKEPEHFIRSKLIAPIVNKQELVSNGIYALYSIWASRFAKFLM